MDIDIENLASLARIALTEKEKESLKNELVSILGYVSELNKAEESGGVTASLGPLQNVFRDDVDPYAPGEFTKEILENAPETEDGYLVVKKILEKNPYED